MILFLDFDGVLHPDAAYRLPGRGIVLKTANLPEEYADAELFSYVPVLEALLADHPAVRIVLSTSWVSVLGFDRTKARLSPRLQARVIGATFHRLHTPRWHAATRYEQILAHVKRHGLGRRWIALDNDAWGWPQAQGEHLVLTDDWRGLGDPTAQARLRERLAWLTFGGPW